MLTWTCGFCDEKRHDTVEESLKQFAHEHLKAEHWDAVEDAFREEWSGKHCQAGCGYRFPDDPDDHPGLQCPRCGNDHFNYYAGLRIFFRTEEPSSKTW